MSWCFSAAAVSAVVLLCWRCKRHERYSRIGHIGDERRRGADPDPAQGNACKQAAAVCDIGMPRMPAFSEVVDG